MYTTKSLFTRANFDINQTITWKMLSDDQCEEIVMTAFEILERTGADILSEKARDIFAAGGCWVDGDRVRFPSAKLEWALRSAPSRVTLCDRNGKRAILMETDNVHYGPGFGNDSILDMESGEIRAITKADVADIAKMCCSLKDVDFVMDSGLPGDVKEKVAAVHAFEAMVSHTTKPIIQEVDCVQQAQTVMDMAAVVAGGADKLQMNPFVALCVVNKEPLSHAANLLDIVIAASQKGVPVIYNSQLVSGLTAPNQCAGALVVALCNALVGVMLSQLAQEGAALIAGGFFTIHDTDHGVAPYGAPEVSLMGTGFANVLRFLRVPSFGFAGGSDTKTSDAQLGLESTFSILHAGLAGTNLVHGGGQIESGRTFSAISLAIGDEVMGMTRRIMRGIAIDEDRLARGVIDDVQPGGHYLGTEHTMYYFKTEQFWPELMNRNRIDDWMAAGSKTLGVRAKEKVQDMLKFYEGQPLDDAIAAQLKEIIAKAEAAL